LFLRKLPEGIDVRVIRLRWRSIKIIGIFGLVASLALGISVPDYFAVADVENADLKALAGRVVAIDPGHGGIDGGAKSGSIEEKNITLDLALKLGRVLEANGAKVIYTRTTDIDYYTRGRGGKRNDLLKRVAIINTSGAAVFISVHVNSIRGSRWSGAEVYYNPKVPENRRLAETIQQVMQFFPPGNKRQAKQDNDILVLKDTQVPGVLLEAGFLSNPQEAALLVDGVYQQRLAEHVARALAYYFSHDVAR
jgi:N-acetylmuramoyl-L-alanine amidase